jgi:integrase
MSQPIRSANEKPNDLLADVCAKTLQADTAKARIWLLASCWDWAKGKYHVTQQNPFRGLSDRFRSQPKKRPRPFSVVEVRAILDGFRSSQYYAHYT